ncbi:MAG: hypothetical protein KJ879_00745 [Nanoarchaeota archaeon]|nr:hypothetical protein [Nanoarchaeota archaeon]
MKKQKNPKRNWWRKLKNMNDKLNGWFISFWFVFLIAFGLFWLCLMLVTSFMELGIMSLAVSIGLYILLSIFTVNCFDPKKKWIIKWYLLSSAFILSLIITVIIRAYF